LSCRKFSETAPIVGLSRWGWLSLFPVMKNTLVIFLHLKRLGSEGAAKPHSFYTARSIGPVLVFNKNRFILSASIYAVIHKTQVRSIPRAG